ncbi:MAG: NAD-glutamate dehydrogenase, partial [Methylobacteriaceae bacterium]|nr:NAD-glutamate dehydrogenase [Methylobacteriaceae bacterium]
MNETTSAGPASAATDVPAGFASALFGRSAPEDLAQYTSAGLARLAQDAFAHLSAPRPQRRHHIRVFDPDASADERLAVISVVEVVNDDMPFLLDSTLGELGALDFEIKLVAHPIFGVERDVDRRLARLDLTPASGSRESLIHIHVERLADAAARDRLIEALDRVYGEVRVAVEDWAAMRARIVEATAAYEASPPPLPADEIAEAVEFLHWLAADNFTFLGIREYRFADAGSTDLDAVGGSGLGILRDPSVKVLRRGKELVTVTPEVLEFLNEPHALIIAKANVKSRVHRRVHMDYIGVKLFSAAGKLEGELRLVGLFTSSTYTRSTQTIPYIRHKIARVLAASGLDPRSHSGKVLTNVLETYPRDELFQVDIETLAKFAGEVAALDERPRLRVLPRVDRFDRFVSVLTYIPRDRYDTSVRLRVADYLARIYNGRVSAFYPFYPEGPLVRTHFIIGRDEGTTPQVSRAELETGVGDIVRTWSDRLKDALLDLKSAGSAQLAIRYATAFSPGYVDAFGTGDALADIAVVERLSSDKPQAVVVYRGLGEPETRAGLKVYSHGRPMPLSERVPLLEHMGFRVINESTYDIRPVDMGGEVWLHDMALERASGGDIDTAGRGRAIEEALAAMFRGEAESDGYNALVLEAGLAWRDVAMLRALSRFLQQTRIRYSQDYMWATLVKNAAVAAKLVELVYARFDPGPTIGSEERAGR